MFRGWMKLGGTEIVNTRRTAEYVRRGIKNATLQLVHDDSWEYQHVWLHRDAPYSIPARDQDCPWLDERVPASREFAGLWTTSVEGGNFAPVEREAVERSSDGAVLKRARIPSRVVTVEAVAIGQSHDGLMWGLKWLQEALHGRPRRLEVLSHAPQLPLTATEEDIQRAGDAEYRFLDDVAVTGQIEVDEWGGVDTYTRRGATTATVKFELTCANPYYWRKPATLVSRIMPAGGEPDDTIFDNARRSDKPASGVLYPLGDSDVPQLPRPLSLAARLAASPMSIRRSVEYIDNDRIPPVGVLIPIVTVHTGPQEEERIRVTWTPGRSYGQEEIDAATIGEAMIVRAPAYSTIVLDGVSHRATCTTSNGEILDASPSVVGTGGGPWSAPLIEGGRDYTIFVDADSKVHDDTRVEISVAAREL